MNSSMIVTEPLRRQAWEEIGWAGREVLSDEAHVYVYLQRTADGRIAIGGRGVPYRFGSRTDGGGDDGAARPCASLRAKLAAMFPRRRRRRDRARLVGRARRAARLVRVGRCRSAPRGLAWAGGYVGEGVAAANLAGAHAARPDPRSASELVATLPWVGRAPRRVGARAAALGGDPRRCTRSTAQADRDRARAAGGPRAWRGSWTRPPGATER